jgi:hypothetical protein
LGLTVWIPVNPRYVSGGVILHVSTARNAGDTLSTCITISLSASDAFESSHREWGNSNKFSLTVQMETRKWSRCIEGNQAEQHSRVTESSDSHAFMNLN